MRLSQLAVLSSLSISLAVPALTVPALAASRVHRASSAGHKLPAKHAAKSKSRSKPQLQSQRSIDDDRATAIQSALIQAGYLSGTPSGHWDSTSEAAMQKMQAVNGWQTKLVPDSRALIKLGLGPGSSTPSSQSATTSPVSGGASDSLAQTLR